MTSKAEKIAVIGAGFSGIGAGYSTSLLGGGTCTVFEKDDTFGGLCGGFSIGGFHFDKAVHLSFAKEPLCQELFFSVPHEVHQPESTNYKSGYWVRHPAQNNLRTLPVEERIRIIEGFAARQHVEDGANAKVETYRDWLRLQFGDYFSEHYPEAYTRKYWGARAEELSTTWCSGRIYQPSLREVLFGSYPDADQSANVYYAKEMRYPKQGGYRTFVQKAADQLDIRYGWEVCAIDTDAKVLHFTNGEQYAYDRLISTMPLPEILPLVCDDEALLQDAAQLEATSMALVSVGFCREIEPPALWFYVYDEDIPFARVHSPSMKSAWNAPKGKSSLQFEVYYSKEMPLAYSDDELQEKVLQSMERMGLASREDVEVIDVRHVKYANVIFYQGMEQHRDNVLRYLASKDIHSCGRFGKWDYLWSNRSFLSGVDAAKQIGEEE